MKINAYSCLTGKELEVDVIWPSTSNWTENIKIKMALNMNTNTSSLTFQIEERSRTMQQMRSNNRVLDYLMKKKIEGKLPGVLGRLVSENTLRISATNLSNRLSYYLYLGRFGWHRCQIRCGHIDVLRPLRQYRGRRCWDCSKVHRFDEAGQCWPRHIHCIGKNCPLCTAN